MPDTKTRIISSLTGTKPNVVPMANIVKDANGNVVIEKAENSQASAATTSPNIVPIATISKNDAGEVVVQKTEDKHVPTPIKEIKRFNDDLPESSMYDTRETVRELRAAFKGSDLLNDQAVFVHLKGKPTKQRLLTSEKFERDDIFNTLYYSDVLRITLDILGWLGDPEFKDDKQREEKLLELGRLNGYPSDEVFEFGFWKHRNEIAILVSEALTEINAKLVIKPDTETKTDTDNRLEAAKVPEGELPIPKFGRGKQKQQGADNKTNVAGFSENVPKQIQYQALWLKNYAIHKIVLDMGLDITKLDPATLQFLNLQVEGVVLKYLSDPTNLAKINDLGLQNADIGRIEAFNNIIFELQKISLKVKVLNQETNQVEDVEIAIEVTEAQTVDLEDSLRLTLATAIEDPNTEARVLNDPRTIKSIISEINRAIAFKATDSYDDVTLQNVVDIIFEITGVRLSSEEVANLAPMLKSYVALQISEKAYRQQSADVSKPALPSAAVPHYDAFVARFGSKIADTALTGTEDHVAITKTNDAEKEFLRNSLVSPEMYAQYKNMYAFYFGLTPAQQKAFIEANGGTPVKIAGQDGFMMPTDIFNYKQVEVLREVKEITIKKEVAGVVQEKTVSFNVEQSMSQAQEQLTVYNIETYQIVEYTRELPAEYLDALLNQARAELIQEYTVKLENLQQLQQEMAVAEFQERAQFYQAKIQAAQEASLFDIGSQHVYNADKTVYEQYSQDPNTVMGTSAPPEGQSRLQQFRNFFSGDRDRGTSILPPEARKAQAMANTAKDLAQIGAALSTGNFLAALKTKTARDALKKTALVGGLIGGGITVTALATGVNKFFTQLGMAMGGPNGMLIGNAIGSTLMGQKPMFLGGPNPFGASPLESMAEKLGMGSQTPSMSSAVNPQTASPGSVAQSLGNQLTQGSTPAQAAASGATTAATAGTAAATTAGVTGAAQAAAVKAVSILAIPAVLAPMTMLLLVFFISLYTIWVIQWSFLAPLPIGNPKANTSTFSQYISVTKTANPDNFEDFTEGQTEQVTYTITITPKAQYQIELDDMTDTFSFLGKVDDSEDSMVPPKLGPLALFPEDPLEHPLSVSNFETEAGEVVGQGEKIKGEARTTYTVTMINDNGTLAKDVLVNNTFKLNFKVFDAQGQFITSDSIDAVGSVMIGDPVVTGCWPTRGKILQEPYGDYSHDSPFPQDAYDIATPGNPKIYAPFAGSACYKTSADWYGNHVLLTTTTGFTFLFAHMLDFNSDIPACDVAGTGIAVNPSFVLGRMNNTGNSTGDHLHYELKANALGKKLDDFIPPGEGYNGNDVVSCYE